MFDIGFWELATLGVIALIVLGPERLPVVARTMGKWVARAKGYMNAITSELEREVKADEIREEVRRAREQIESETRHVHSQTRESVEPVMQPLDPSSKAQPVQKTQKPDASGAQAPATSSDSTQHSTTAGDESAAHAKPSQDSGHSDR